MIREQRRGGRPATSGVLLVAAVAVLAGVGVAWLVRSGSFAASGSGWREALGPLAESLKRPEFEMLAPRPLAPFEKPTPPQRDATGETASGTLAYEFSGAHRTLTVPIVGDDLRYDVDVGPLWTMNALEKRRERIASWADAYSRTPMVEALTVEFRRERTRLGLSSDSYAELLASVVQQVPYGDADPEFMRCPARVVAENQGDCDEKSLLLAALLVHEGYEVALLEFVAENHVTVGIRSDELGYRGGLWATLESTRRSYVGETGEVRTPSGSTTLRSRPTVYPLGGTIEYESGAQVEYILRRAREAAAEIERLEPAARRASQSQPATPDQAQRANEVIGRYNAQVKIHRRAVEGSTDRAATYQWLRGN